MLSIVNVVATHASVLANLEPDTNTQLPGEKT
jgi:hypothetical protein